MKWFKTFIDDAPDLKRRSFIFGAVATALAIPAAKSFFIIEPPKLIVEPPKLLFDLPLQQVLDLQKKLDEQEIHLSQVPRWVVIQKDQYDLLVKAGLPPPPILHKLVDRRITPHWEKRHDDAIRPA